MSLNTINTLLADNTYPGRGIVIGKSPDGKNAVIAYFIMGRSENSRNRLFEEDLNDGIRTRAYDESKLSDPSLVIYSAVKVIGNSTIVTNGDQTDTIYDFLDESGSFVEALRTRTFEPDSPLFTPRISGIVELSEHDFSYKLSILKSNRGNGDSALRFFFEYEQPVSGEGHLIHTYKQDGNPPESFEGEPKAIAIDDNIDDFSSSLWESLNEQNKISLFVRYINLENGEFNTRIINKNK